MNYLAIIHLVAAALVAIAAVPLVKRRVPMNSFYGVRIAASFESQERWYDINAYGGRLLLVWAALVSVWSLIGLAMSSRHMLAYSIVSLVPILGGIALVAVQVFRYANRRSNKAL